MISSIRRTAETCPAPRSALLSSLRLSLLSKPSLMGRHYAITPAQPTGGEGAPLTFNRKSVEGAELTIDGTSGVMVNKAKVVKQEISASNGVIHVIDSVLTPPKA